MQKLGASRSTAIRRGLIPLAIASLAIGLGSFSARSQTPRLPNQPETPSATSTSASTQSPAPPAGATARGVSQGAPGSSSQQPVDRATSFVHAVNEVLAGILDHGWPIVALVALLMLRKPLIGLLVAVTTAMEERGVNLDIGTVKVQVTERALDTSDDRLWRSSTVLFDFDGDSALERPTILKDIAFQLPFVVSQYVGEQWSLSHPGDLAAMDLAYAALSEALARGDKTPNVQPKLESYARACERCRFFKAERFAGLLQEHAALAETVLGLSPRLPAAPEECLIVHTAAMAFAQRSQWADGMKALGRFEQKDQRPSYLPVGDVWLACVYHDYLLRSLKTDAAKRLDSYLLELETTAEGLVASGQKIAAEMDQVQKWDDFPISAHNVGFYKREIQKVIGTIAGSVAESADAPEMRERLLDRAQAALELANATIDGEPPSPLDRNNLADLYRQRGYCDNALVEITKAFEDRSPPDPIFYDTLAQIHWRQGDQQRAINALRQYGETQARKGNLQAVTPYIENQMLAAKMLAASSSTNVTVKLAQAADLLESARTFVEEQAAQHKEWQADALRSQLDELLAFLYLGMQGYEGRAVEAFERLDAASRNDDTATERQWERRLGYANALTHSARASRRNLSSGLATARRVRAANLLKDATTGVSVFGLDGSIRPQRRTRHFVLQINTVVALHDLAQEKFSAGEYKDARDLLTQEATILAALRERLSNEPPLAPVLGSDAGSISTQIKLNDARRSFLLGRTMIQCDPGFSEAGMIGNARSALESARGNSATFDCRIDLVLGEMYLAAALATQGLDVLSHYENAVRFFELATTRDAPTLRSETVRALADVYARRSFVLRKAKSSK